MIFAEADTLTTAVVAIVGTVATGSGVAGVIQLWKVWREGRLGDRKDSLAEWAKIHEFDTARIDRLEKAADDSAVRERACERRCSMLESEVMYMRNWCEAKGMPVKPWSPDGSAQSPALKGGV
jgi:hypothetical protein